MFALAVNLVSLIDIEVYTIDTVMASFVVGGFFLCSIASWTRY